MHADKDKETGHREGTSLIFDLLERSLTMRVSFARDIGFMLGIAVGRLFPCNGCCCFSEEKCQFHSKYFVRRIFSLNRSAFNADALLSFGALSEEKLLSRMHCFQRRSYFSIDMLSKKKLLFRLQCLRRRRCSFNCSTFKEEVALSIDMVLKKESLFPSKHFQRRSCSLENNVVREGVALAFELPSEEQRRLRFECFGKISVTFDCSALKRKASLSFSVLRKDKCHFRSQCFEMESVAFVRSASLLRLPLRMAKLTALKRMISTVMNLEMMKQSF